MVAVLLDYLQSKLRLEGIVQVLAQPAGPELALEQRGEDELMPLPVLDACFHLFAEEKLAPEEVQEVLRTLFPELAEATVRAHVEKFVRLFLGSVSKWVQAPLSLHLGNLDLDRERALQLPVVNRPKSAWPKKPKAAPALGRKPARARKPLKGRR